MEGLNINDYINNKLSNFIKIKLDKETNAYFNKINEDEIFYTQKDNDDTILNTGFFNFDNILGIVSENKIRKTDSFIHDNRVLLEIMNNKQELFIHLLLIILNDKKEFDYIKNLDIESNFCILLEKSYIIDIFDNKKTAIFFIKDYILLFVFEKNTLEINNIFTLNSRHFNNAKCLVLEDLNIKIDKETTIQAIDNQTYEKIKMMFLLKENTSSLVKNKELIDLKTNF